MSAASRPRKIPKRKCFLWSNSCCYPCWTRTGLVTSRFDSNKEEAGYEHAPFAFAASVLLAALPAQAQLLATGSRANNYTSSTTGAWVTVPIKDTLTTINFATSAPNQTVRLTYNAECGAVGSPGAWLAIQILVDGLPTDPNSGVSFAMCTATSTTSYSWTGAVRQSTLLVPHSGTHKVTVQGYGVSTTTWWLGDTSLVVDR